MSNSPSTSKWRIIAIRLVAMAALVWGGAYLAAGGGLLLIGNDLLPVENYELADVILREFDDSIFVLAFVGNVFVIVGSVAIVAAMGLFFGKSWANPLTLFIALLAIISGLCFHSVFPPRDGMMTGLGLTFSALEVLGGGVVFAFLAWNTANPVGVNFLGLLNTMAGLPVALFLGKFTAELFFGINEWMQGRRPEVDLSGSFLALAVSFGFFASLLTVATGLALLPKRIPRFTLVRWLLIATIGAAVAAGAASLVGGVLGRSRGGLAEAGMLVVLLPFAIVLMLLAAAEFWYVGRPAIRSSLEAKHECQ